MSRFDVYGVASSVGEDGVKGWCPPVGPLHAAGDFLFRAGTCCACGDGNPVPDGVDCPRSEGHAPGRTEMSPAVQPCPDGAARRPRPTLPRKAQVKNSEAKGLVS